MHGTILITGGSGLVGRALTRLLLDEDYRVNHLSRRPVRPENPNVQVFAWDPGKGYADPGCISGVSAIVHLAGENIGKERWTPERRRAIAASRTGSIRLLYDLLRRTPDHQVRAVVSASAAGYYGDRGDEVLTESSGPGKGFLSETVTAWEQAVSEGEDLGLRTALLRCGIVLDRRDGALPELEKPLRAGFAFALGSGKQWVPWIHIRDLARLYEFMLRSDGLQGPFNACAPEQVTNSGLIAAIRQKKGPSLPLPNVPGFMLRAILGDRSELVLTSTRMSSYSIETSGFSFQYPTLQAALDDLYSG